MGMLGMAVLKLLSAANEEASAYLAQVPQELGPLGLFKGIQAVANVLTQADAAMAQVRWTHPHFLFVSHLWCSWLPETVHEVLGKAVVTALTQADASMAQVRQ